jgi:hypothetical protein
MPHVLQYHLVSLIVLFVVHTQHILVGVLSLFMAGNFTKICSFLFLSNCEGGSLVGALFGGPRYVECADDVEACVDVSESCSSSDKIFLLAIFPP